MAGRIGSKGGEVPAADELGAGDDNVGVTERSIRRVETAFSFSSMDEGIREVTHGEGCAALYNELWSWT